MPYLVTSGSHFRPFTYDELVKPLAQMTEAQNAAADQYEAVAMETDALAQYLESEPEDSRARMLYDAYRNRLKTLQDNLWANGYNSGTRRDLTAARQAYASDVVPIQKAIQTRQERSKEFWDYRHKNPDAVTGIDPGLGSIDDYIANPSYGQNWYNYSGNQFAKEVGQDVLAQAQELIRSGKVPEGSQVYGQIMQALNYGFTSGEVNNVKQAVRRYMAGDETAFNGLSTNENLMASVLMSHLSSTGATNNELTEGDFDRFVEYGLSGLSAGILGTKLNNYTDPNVALQKSIALANYEHKLKMEEAAFKAQLAGAGQQQQAFYPMIPSQQEAPGYREFEASQEKYRKHYKDTSYTIVTPDEQAHEVTDQWTMADLFYNPEIRQQYREKYNGLDIMLSPTSSLLSGEKRHRHFQLKDNKSGKMIDFRLAKMDKDTAEERGLDPSTAVEVQISSGGKWVEYKNADGKAEFSDDISKARQQAFEYVDAMKEANKNVFDVDHLDRYAISPEEQYNMRKEHNVPLTTDARYLKDVMTTANRIHEVTAAQLVNGDNPDKTARNAFAESIRMKWDDTVRHEGKVGPGSPYAFYEVKADGKTHKDKGVGAAEVFGVDKNGKIYFRDNLDSIMLYPEQAAKGAGNSRPMFTITAQGKTYHVDAMMLGEDVYNMLKTASVPNLEDNNGGAWTECDLINYLMMPILHPSKALGLSRDDAETWTMAALSAFGLNPEAIPEEQMPTPSKCVRDKGWQEWLEDACRVRLQRMMETPLANRNIYHRQSTGMTSSKAISNED